MLPSQACCLMQFKKLPETPRKGESVTVNQLTDIVTGSRIAQSITSNLALTMRMQTQRQSVWILVVLFFPSPLHDFSCNVFRQTFVTEDQSCVASFRPFLELCFLNNLKAVLEEEGKIRGRNVFPS